ncbi:hypothetical protein FOA52_006115 [Chlamydomonas sp. UWO 241]|nr:hypothetical protein FOA52_006115 [Chlamydomonas sp. UWO 241]
MMTSDSVPCIKIGDALAAMPSWGELVGSIRHGTAEEYRRTKLCLTVWLAEERERGTSSPWHWFLSGLPTSTGNLPRRFTGHDAQLLEGSMAALLARKYVEGDVATYKVLVAELPEGMMAGVAEEAYVWASDINTMRVFGTPGTRPGLRIASSKPSSARAMVPLADMFNHAHGSAYNCRWKFNDTADMFQIKAGQDLDPANVTDLTVTYGPTKSNAMLFQLYGFVMEPPEASPATTSALYGRVSQHNMVHVRLDLRSDVEAAASKLRALQVMDGNQCSAMLPGDVRALNYSLAPGVLASVCLTPRARAGFYNVVKTMIGVARLIAATKAELFSPKSKLAVWTTDAERAMHPGLLKHLRESARLSSESEAHAQALLTSAVDSALAAFDTSEQHDLEMLQRACSNETIGDSAGAAGAQSQGVGSSIGAECLRPFSNARNAVITRWQEKRDLILLRSTLLSNVNTPGQTTS